MTRGKVLNTPTLIIPKITWTIVSSRSAAITAFNSNGTNKSIINRQLTFETILFYFLMKLLRGLRKAFNYFGGDYHQPPKIKPTSKQNVTE